MRHVQDDLTALVDGALPPERQAEVEAHLAGCAGCRAERDLVASAVRMVAAVPAPAAPAPGFEQRFYARLAREKAARPSRRERLPGSRWRWAAPLAALGAAAAVAVTVGVAETRSDRLEMARHLDLLENYVVVASLDTVESAEDVEVVEHLNELEARP